MRADKSLFWVVLFGILFSCHLSGQSPQDWIDYGQSYYKISVSEDGIYRIGAEQLESAGIDLASVRGDWFALYWMGEEIPIYLSTDGFFGPSDYIEFYGRRQRAELDRLLFEDADAEMLNPEVALYSSVSTYFLTWDEAGGHLRYGLEQNDLGGQLPDPVSHYMHREELVIRDAFVKARTFEFGVRNSTFESGEGIGTALRRDNSRELKVVALSNDGDEAFLSFRLTGNVTRNQHEVYCFWNGESFDTLFFRGGDLVRGEYSFSIDKLRDVNTLLFKGIRDGGVADRNSIGYVSLRYPRQFVAPSADFFEFSLREKAEASGLLAWQGLAGKMRLYGLGSRRIWDAEDESGLVRFFIEQDLAQDYVLVSEDAIRRVELEAVNFEDLSTDDVDYLIISHSRLYDDGHGNNWVQAYAEYRSSVPGGGYKVRIVEIGQLIDQFAYGVAHHPWSIKGFARYAKEHWPNLKYVFLIGKGLQYDQIQFAEEELVERYSLLPSFGVYGSDNLLLSEGNSVVPLFAVGRLAAETAEKVKIYLDKLKVFDANLRDAAQTIEAKSLLKRALHLGGGNGNAQQQSILNGLKRFESHFEQGTFGGDVFTFTKLSNEEIEDVPPSSQAAQWLDEGVVLKTYFGHGSVELVQFQNLEDPATINNIDRTPVMNAWGCSTGNCFLAHDRSLGERNVFAARKGAISYSATSGIGHIGTIQSFGSVWYDMISTEMYGEPIGEAYRKTNERLKNATGALRQLLEQLIFQGDPAIRMAAEFGPDYTMDFRSARTVPGIVNLAMDSFLFEVDIYNLGLHRDDSLSVRIVHELPGQQGADTVFLRVDAPGFRNKLVFRLPNQGERSLGLNKIYVTVDPRNEIEELPLPFSESNNELESDFGERGFSFFVVSGGVRAIYPPEFAIVNDAEGLVLSGSILDPLGVSQGYVFELDTTELFDSPSKVRYETSGSVGLVQWRPGLILSPGQVYYWRVSADSTESPGYNWSQSSFSYLPDEGLGWNQGHYYQYLRNDLDSIILNDKRELEFFAERLDNIIFKIKVNEGRGEWITTGGDVFASLNTSQYGNVFAFRGREPNLRAIRKSDFGAYGSLGSNGVYFYKMDTIEDRKNLIDLLEVIPEGTVVLIYTILVDTLADFHFGDWEQDAATLGRSLFDVLESEGAQLIRLTKDRGTVPYFLAYRKGEGLLAEMIGTTIHDEIFGQVNGVKINGTEGSFRTRRIGPAQRWHELSWSLSSNDLEGDSTLLQVFKIDREGQAVLHHNLDKEERRLDLSGIDASQYPHLLIRYYSSDRDDSLRTPSQLHYLRVNYDGLPDAALGMSEDIVFERDSMVQGETFRFEAGIVNVSDFDMDSLLVKYSLVSENNNRIDRYARLAPLKSGDRLTTQFSMSTLELEGRQQFVLQVNPDEDQPELHLFNNLYSRSFYVQGDRIKPLLDVRFDGVHIINGDLVSSQPEIVIRLEDENKYLLLNDTSLFAIEFVYPDNSVHQVRFGSEEVEFFPAQSGENNTSRVELRPKFVQDGIYSLRVLAKDVSQNLSGALAYEIRFEVVTKRMLSKLINYPNPFSTSTRFVYTLTGDGSPERFKIQVMTANGRIVRELTEAELGPLRVGRHMTDYAWDGTDEYGDPLANGVYLYRMVLEGGDQEVFEDYETSIDRYFKKGFGKMVILR